MLVTKQGDYAVRCVLALAGDAGKVLSAARLAETTRVPRSFLAKILQRLVKAGLAASARGVNGGFSLARKPEEITILDVLRAVRSAPAVNVCAVEGGRCGFSRTCAVHPVWVDLRLELERRLRTETFAKLMAKA